MRLAAGLLGLVLFAGGCVSVGARTPKTVVFLGSSSIEFWKTLAADFPDYRTVNLGKAATDYPFLTERAAKWAEENPASAFVLYSGDNDVAAGASPEKVAADFRRTVEALRSRRSDASVLVISIKPSPVPDRLAKLDLIRKANAGIRAECANLGVIYVDVFTPMLGPDDAPRAELFGPDRLHLSPEGYRLWTRRVRSGLLAAGANELHRSH